MRLCGASRGNADANTCRFLLAKTGRSAENAFVPQNDFQVALRCPASLIYGPASGTRGQKEDSMHSVWMGEFMGTLVLILLGTGVNAGVLLRKSLAADSGWIVI